MWFENKFVSLQHETLKSERNTINLQNDMMNNQNSKKAAHVIMTDGIALKTEPKNGTDFSLEEMQKIVGGYIEILRLGSELIMVVNEEGKLNGLGFNAKATILARAAGYDDYIVGDVLVCPSDMVK